LSSLLAANANDHPGHHDLDLGGPNLASLVLATTRDPLGQDPHVHHHLPSPPSWLQLLATLLVIVILILVV
jgi:hypothetical protein